MNRKGFTMIELLAVIALIGVVALLVTPKLISIFKTSTNKTMQVQESEISEAGLLYLEDYCKNPVGSNRCPGTINRESDYTYSGHVSLSLLESLKYIEEVQLNDVSCNGCVVFDHNKAKAYLKCGDSYVSENIDPVCGL